jgi:hypothetical protein
MQAFLTLLLLLEVAALPPRPIDPQRLAAASAFDADVLRALKEHGDVPSIVRPVDVTFVGTPDKVRSLQDQIRSLGWRFVQRTQLNDGREALDVQRDQRTDAGSIQRLTKTALTIEAHFDVEYDGWGTEATKR